MMTTERKNGWGGKRPGAGRPRRDVAEASKPTPHPTSWAIPRGTVQIPIVRAKRTDAERARHRYGFKDLEGQPGIRILDRATQIPMRRRGYSDQK